MKRILLSIQLVFILILPLTIPVSANENLPLVVDQAGILTPAELASLEVKVQNIRNEYEMDVVILTIDSLDGQSPQAYADNYYDTHGYGYGEDASGLLFFLAIEDREWYISTFGKAVYVLTDYGIQEIAESSFYFLDNTGYFGLFDAFLMYLPDYMDAYESGTPIDGYADYSGDFYHGTQDEIIYYEEDSAPSIVFSLAIGFIIAAAVVLIMRGSMNTKRPQYNASSYIKTGSFHLDFHQDLFLYSNVSKVRKQQNTSGNGGGSSVHRSSTGHRHGGGGGRF